MPHRLNLESLSDAERRTLADLIRKFLTQPVIRNHRKVRHMEQFFAHHRAYIFGLEMFLKRTVTDADLLRKIVPLPFWNSTRPLPSQFSTFNGGHAVAANEREPLSELLDDLPPVPTPPVPPPPFSPPAALVAYVAAMASYDDALVQWKQAVKDAILLHPPVTDTNYLNLSYPGKQFPRNSGLDRPQDFASPHDLCEAHPDGRGLGMDITEGLIRTATHYHGITHSSLAGLDTPVDLDHLIEWLLAGGPAGATDFTIGPFMNGFNTAAPFIFWPLHAFFDTFYYRWEEAHLRPLVSPCVERNPGKDSELELFQLGKEGKIWHCCHAGSGGPNTDNGRFGNWEHWHHVGGDMRLRRMTLALNIRTNNIELFGITNDANKSLVHAQMIGPKCERWTSWDNLGGSNKALSVVAGGNGLDVFAIQLDDAIWHKRRGTSGNWSSWDRLFDVNQSQLATIVDDSGPGARIHVFSLGNAYIWHRWETSAAGSWVGPQEHVVNGYTRQFRSFAVARNQNNRLELFGIGTDNKVYHSRQNAAGANNDFAPWQVLDNGPAAEIAVGRNRDGRLEIFICSPGAVRHRWQVAPNGAWANGESIPLDAPMGSLKQPFTARDPEGRLMIFGVADDGLLWHAWQNQPNVGPWIGWLVI